MTKGKSPSSVSSFIVSQALPPFRVWGQRLVAYRFGDKLGKILPLCKNTPEQALVTKQTIQTLKTNT